MTNKPEQNYRKKVFVTPVDVQHFRSDNFAGQIIKTMKQEVLEVLEVRSAKTRKIGTPDVKSRKYNGSPNLKLKKVKTEPRQKIRQLLRACIPLEELKPSGNLARLKG